MYQGNISIFKELNNFYFYIYIYFFKFSNFHKASRYLGMWNYDV